MKQCTRSILFFCSILFFFQQSAQAQYPKDDTLIKFIYMDDYLGLGPGGFSGVTYTKFTDPNGNPNHVELKIISGFPGGIQIDNPVRDSISHDEFVIAGFQSGLYLIKATYKCQAAGCTDSGAEYIYVRVYKDNKREKKWDYWSEYPQIITIPVKKELFAINSDTVKVWRSDTRVYLRDTIVEKNSLDPEFWEAPPGRRIVDIATSTGETNVLYILLDDGTIYRSVWDAHFGFPAPVKINPPGSSINESWIQLKGDDLYLVSSSKIYVTRDYGVSWQVDTAGLASALPSAMALDSNQNVYLAASSGLFKQGPKENTWHPLSTQPIGYLTHIFIDRRDRIIVTGFSSKGQVFISTDHGTTWTADTSGLGNQYIASFADDSYGNLYLITSDAFAPNRLYRSPGGTGSWQEIGQSIRSEAIDSSNTSVFQSLAGTKSVLLSTQYGLYESADQGSSWHEVPVASVEMNLYAMARSSDGSFFVSTNRGIYQGKMGDSIWAKRYPVSGFTNGAQLFRDNNGILYTLGPIRHLGYATKQPHTYYSNDNGLNWKLDSLGDDGVIPISGGAWYVDAHGVQHLAVRQYGKRLELFSKTSGSVWTRDEQGFVGDSGAFGSFIGADNDGSIYLFSNTMVWKRNHASGSWAPDTSGLNGDLIIQVTGSKNTDIFASTIGGNLVHWDGNFWKVVPAPVSGSGNGVAGISSDSGGYLFAATYNSGVYFTNDRGVHWASAGLDGRAVTGLYSAPDSTYALTGRGIYAMTHTAASAVKVAPAASGIEIALSPNPNSGNVQVYYELPKRSLVKIAIVSALGEVIRSTSEESEDEGAYQKHFDVSTLASGNYFVMVFCDGEVTVKKLGIVH